MEYFVHIYWRAAPGDPWTKEIRKIRALDQDDACAIIREACSQEFIDWEVWVVKPGEDEP